MSVLNIGSRIVNNWLYPIGGGFVLIDTGYPGGFSHFRKRLGRLGITPGQIRYVFLTHAHDDHAGFLNEVLETCGEAQVILSPQALEGLERGQNSFQGGCTSPLALLFCRLMALFGKGAHTFPSLRPEFQDRCLTADGSSRKTLETLLCGRIIDTPGHTVDSLSLLLPDGSLFCGDAAMRGFPSLRNITIWAEDSSEYLRSWETILALDAKRIYPGHGMPFAPAALARNIGYAQNMKLRPLR